MPAYISSIGTSVPPNKIAQKDILRFMQRHLSLDSEGDKKLNVLYRASGIESRYSVLSDYAQEVSNYSFYPPNDVLEPFPDLEKRMDIYEREAIKLAVQAVKTCLQETNVLPKDVTHLITVSCTGMYAPGIDIDLVQQLGMPTSTSRTNVNFMGCYAAFNGLKIANDIVHNDPEAKVVMVCVELCSIHFQKTNDEDNLLSSALFADGAASVLIEGTKGLKFPMLEMSAFHSDLALTAKADMSWKIGNMGFLMKLSPKVPDTIRAGIKQLTDRLLAKLDLTKEEIDFYAIHPGGKRILEVIEQELCISKVDNIYAYETLKQYGNMSSCTVLFVIKRLIDNQADLAHKKNILSFAFGPGLTLESMLLKIHTY